MSYLADNLKYLLWDILRQEHLSMDEYEAFLRKVANGCGISFERFRRILDGSVEGTGSETDRIKERFREYDTENVPYIELDLMFQKDIETHKNDLILDNILYLLRSIPWGDNQEFTEALHIRGSTLTRWKSGTMKPSRHFQKEICKYFGIGEPDELKLAYLFFGLSPATTPQRKLECKRLIDAMDREEFERMYPALRKLLK